MHEALAYEQLKNSKVRCLTCDKRCKLSDNAYGACGVRKNTHGRLEVLNYGMIRAASLDPIEKKPIYHYLPGTTSFSIGAPGCNMHCGWCQNISLAHPKTLKRLGEKRWSPSDPVSMALARGASSIAYTYSEPTMFIEYALDVMKRAKASGLKNIWVSNGMMSKDSKDALRHYVDAANIDLKGPSHAFYAQHCKGLLDSVLTTIHDWIRFGIHVEITTLVIPGLNDSDDDFHAMITLMTKYATKETVWHLSRFFPAYQYQDISITPLERLERFQMLARQAGFKHVYLGNVSYGERL